MLCVRLNISEHLCIGEHHTQQFGQVLVFIYLSGYVITCKQLDNLGVTFYYRYHLCSFVW